MSIETTLRIVFLSMLGALAVLGIAMDENTYSRKRHLKHAAQRSR